jgi:hypothetical protein
MSATENDVIVDVENEDELDISEKSEANAVAEANALRDNIARKGKNAYYYCHGHNADGPKWDGDPTPRLLEKKSTEGTETVIITKKITKFAYSDESNKVKIYIAFGEIGLPILTSHNFDFNETSISLKLHTTPTTEGSGDRVVVHQFEVTELYDKIEKASLRFKPDKVIVTLVKAEGSTDTWSGLKKK